MTPLPPPGMLLSALLLLTRADAAAPVRDAATSLPPLTVTATRGETDLLTAPYAVLVLPEKTLTERLARTLPEALAQTPGVMVQKTANGQGSPYIRGFTGYRTLMMIDGIRYNNSIYRDGPSEYFSLVDAQSLAAIELIQGPASVLYGSDAIGGTLYLESQSSGYATEAAGETFVHGRTFLRGSTAEHSVIGRFEANTGVGGRWGLHLGASLKDFGDVDAADPGRQPFTGYGEGAWDSRLDLRLSDPWTLTAAFQQLAQDDVWRTHATIFGTSFAGTTVGDDLRRSKDQRRSLAYLKLQGDQPWSGIDKFTATASWQGWREDGTRIRNDRRQEIESLTSQMWGLDLQFESATRIGRLTYGADYYEDHVDSGRIDYHADGSIDQVQIQGPVGDDTVYGMFGLFIQDEIPSGDRLKLLVGARYNHVRAGIGRYADPLTNTPASLGSDWDNLIGSIRASYTLDADGRATWYTGLSQAFRAPNTADLTRFGASRSTEIESAATGLQPENFLTLETGVKLESPTLSGGLCLFNTWLDDYITSTPTGRVIDGRTEVTKRNSAEGWVRGIEAWSEWRLNQQFRLFGNFTWLDGEADAYPDPATGAAIREPLSRLQPFTLTAGARWTHPSDRWWLELSATAVAKADHLNTADRADTQRIPPGGTPGYALINLRSGWQATNRLTLYGSLENLLDEAYRSHGSGSNEPGFGASIGLDLRF